MNWRYIAASDALTLLYVVGVAALAIWALWAEIRRMPRVLDQWSRYRGVMRLREQTRREPPPVNTAELTLSLRRTPRPAAPHQARQ